MKRSRPLEITAVAALDVTLPRVTTEAWRAQVRARPLPYPIGSGQGSELAVQAGLRPMMRELLAHRDIPAAQRRLEAAGLVCEVAPIVYGTTRDGWLKQAPAPDGSEDRSPVFVGRDRRALLDAVEAEQSRTEEGARRLGQLLGYPPCCVEHFSGVSRERRGPELWASALARTHGRPSPRLDVLDLAVFTWLPWYPCSYDCAPSLAFADALVPLVASRHPAFVERIERAHASHRLVLAPEVQLALDGHAQGGEIHGITRWWPAPRDRDPRAPIVAHDAELLARALTWLEGARTVAVRGGQIVVDGVPRSLPGLRAPLPLLVPFGSHAA